MPAWNAPIPAMTSHWTAGDEVRPIVEHPLHRDQLG
jgi:hypothetical protein